MAGYRNRSQFLNRNNEIVDEDEQLQVCIDRLSNHLLQHILERLSAMDLVSCRYVSKTWCLIVKDIYLVKYGTPRIFLQLINDRSEPIDRIKCVSLDFNTKLNPVGIKIVNQFKLPFASQFRFLNSCNSLISLHEGCRDGGVYILNQFTGEYLKIPELTSDKILHGYSYGFGFSNKDNRYKMLRRVDRYLRIDAEICVLDADPRFMTWKRIGLFPYETLPYTGPCVYFNGVLHWIANETDSELVILCCFDLADEKFHRISLPFRLMETRKSYYFENAYDHPLIKIGVLGGYFYFLYGRTTIDIWVMKEYGVNGVWTKYLVIQPPSFTTDFNLIKVFENGEILIRRDARFLFFYDPLTKKFRDVKSNFGDREDICFAYQSVETSSSSSLKKLLTGRQSDSVI